MYRSALLLLAISATTLVVASASASSSSLSKRAATTTCPNPSKCPNLVPKPQLAALASAITTTASTLIGGIITLGPTDTECDTTSTLPPGFTTYCGVRTFEGGSGSSRALLSYARCPDQFKLTIQTDCWALADLPSSKDHQQMQQLLLIDSGALQRTSYCAFNLDGLPDGTTISVYHAMTCGYSARPGESSADAASSNNMSPRQQQIWEKLKAWGENP